VEYFTQMGMRSSIYKFQHMDRKKFIYLVVNPSVKIRAIRGYRFSVTNDKNKLRRLKEV
jgi:hypothetical protein